MKMIFSKLPWAPESGRRLPNAQVSVAWRCEANGPGDLDT